MSPQPGDDVRVTDGPYNGSEGAVLRVDSETQRVDSACSRRTAARKTPALEAARQPCRHARRQRDDKSERQYALGNQQHVMGPVGDAKRRSAGFDQPAFKRTARLAA